MVLPVQPFAHHQKCVEVLGRMPMLEAVSIQTRRQSGLWGGTGERRYLRRNTRRSWWRPADRWSAVRNAQMGRNGRAGGKRLTTAGGRHATGFSGHRHGRVGCRRNRPNRAFVCQSDSMSRATSLWHSEHWPTSSRSFDLITPLKFLIVTECLQRPHQTLDRSAFRVSAGMLCHSLAAGGVNFGKVSTIMRMGSWVAGSCD